MVLLSVSRAMNLFFCSCCFRSWLLFCYDRVTTIVFQVILMLCISISFRPFLIRLVATSRNLSHCIIGERFSTFSLSLYLAIYQELHWYVSAVFTVHGGIIFPWTMVAAFLFFKVACYDKVYPLPWDSFPSIWRLFYVLLDKRNHTTQIWLFCSRHFFRPRPRWRLQFLAARVIIFDRAILPLTTSSFFFPLVQWSTISKGI